MICIMRVVAKRSRFFPACRALDVIGLMNDQNIKSRILLARKLEKTDVRFPTRASNADHERMSPVGRL